MRIDRTAPARWNLPNEAAYGLQSDRAQDKKDKKTRVLCRARVFCVHRIFVYSLKSRLPCSMASRWPRTRV